MDKVTLARTAAAFLQRCSLQPAEINTFVQVMQWLEAEASPRVEEPPPFKE